MGDVPNDPQGRRSGPLDETGLPDGAEAPPPGVRAMSVVRWVLVGLMAVAAAGTWIHHVTAAGAAQTGAAAARYRCPMHPAVVQDRPGSCPICGMDLVAAAAEANAAGAPQATTGGPAAPAADAGRQGAYWCPMHPEVTSDDPNARCAKCGGMKLLPRVEGARTAAAPAAGVPGLVPIDLGAERAQRVGVRTAVVTRSRLSAPLRAVGFVSADEGSLAIVGARYTGWIEQVRVAQSGQRVAKGQVLATVYSQDLVTAQTVYLNAVRWRDKQTQIATSPGAGTGSGIENDARRRLELLGAAPEDMQQLASSGQVLDAFPIRSPVSGYVARRSAVPGLYVQPGTELFQIVDLSHVWVLADVYEGDAGQVHVGQTARLQLAAYPGETFTGKVQLVYPALNPESRTLQARIALPNPGLRLRPGMYGDVLLATPPIEGLTVPADAVVDTGEVQYVFVARDGGRFEPRRIRLGVRRDDRVQVLEGLTAGERVVTTANFLVDSESRLHAAVQGFRAPSAAEEHAESARGDDDAHDQGGAAGHARADGHAR